MGTRAEAGLRNYPVEVFSGVTTTLKLHRASP